MPRSLENALCDPSTTTTVTLSFSLTHSHSVRHRTLRSSHVIPSKSLRLIAAIIYKVHYPDHVLLQTSPQILLQTLFQKATNPGCFKTYIFPKYHIPTYQIMQQLPSPAATPASTPEAARTDTEFLNRLKKAWLSQLHTSATGPIVWSGTMDPKERQMQQCCTALEKKRSDDDPKIETAVYMRIRMDSPLEKIYWEKEMLDYLVMALTKLTCRFVKIPCLGHYRAETAFMYGTDKIDVFFRAWFNADKSEQSSIRSVPCSMLVGDEENKYWDGAETPSITPSISSKPESLS